MVWGGHCGLWDSGEVVKLVVKFAALFGIQPRADGLAWLRPHVSGIRPRQQTPAPPGTERRSGTRALARERAQSVHWRIRRRTIRRTTGMSCFGTDERWRGVRKKRCAGRKISGDARSRRRQIILDERAPRPIIYHSAGVRRPTHTTDALRRSSPHSWRARAASTDCPPASKANWTTAINRRHRTMSNRGTKVSEQRHRHRFVLRNNSLCAVKVINTRSSPVKDARGQPTKVYSTLYFDLVTTSH